MNAFEIMHQRTAELHYTGKDNHGHKIIIDAAELRPNSFEIMAMRPGGAEIETRKAYSLEEARTVYAALLAKYTTPADPPAAPAPLTGKYAQLRDDLRRALEAAQAAYNANPEDGGTCNFDSASLGLPRWNAAKVEQAAEEAGTSCFTWSIFGSKRFVFNPRVPAQGNARSRAAEAMTKALKDMGYDAMDYCQAD